MITPPSHGQPNLVSSSTTQYGEQTHTMYGKIPTPPLQIIAVSFYFVSVFSVILSLSCLLLFYYGDHHCVFYCIFYLDLHMLPF